MLRERFGYAAEVDAVLAANASGCHPVLPAASRRLADDVMIVATYDDLSDAVDRWTDAGADLISLTLPLEADEHELVTAVGAAAPDGGRVVR